MSNRQVENPDCAKTWAIPRPIAPAPITAVVSFCEIAIATTGVIAVPPSAPPFACVVVVCSPVATTETTPAPVRAPETCAVVSLSATLTAIEAPTPGSFRKIESL